MLLFFLVSNLISGADICTFTTQDAFFINSSFYYQSESDFLILDTRIFSMRITFAHLGQPERFEPVRLDNDANQLCPSEHFHHFF